MIPWRTISVLYALVLGARTIKEARRRAFAAGVLEGMRTTSRALGGGQ
jgi:hypothetical protein